MANREELDQDSKELLTLAERLIKESEWLDNNQLFLSLRNEEYLISLSIMRLESQ